MTIINDYDRTETFLRSKLLGAQLDTFQVYSSVLQIDFFVGFMPGRSGSCWLSTLDNISISSDAALFNDRRTVIAELYDLIGQDIKDVKIESNGSLVLSIGGKVLTASLDEDSVEDESWSVTPDSPDIYAEHEWLVALAEGPELVLRLPPI